MTLRPWVRRTAVGTASAAALVALVVPAEAATATSTSSATTTAAATAAEVDYATWQKDCQAVMNQALPELKQRIANTKPGEKQAIVFDIDNTTLETHYTPWYQLPTPAMKPSLTLAKYAKSRGVDVFFVTARPGIIKSITEWNLETVGYPVDGLYVRDLPDLFAEVSAYKTASRADIESDGYTIIANVGNNTTDLVGGHAERTFKLPDYDGLLD